MLAYTWQSGQPCSIAEFYMQVPPSTPWRALVIPDQHVYVLMQNVSYDYAILNIMYVEYNVVSTTKKFPT